MHAHQNVQQSHHKLLLCTFHNSPPKAAKATYAACSSCVVHHSVTFYRDAKYPLHTSPPCYKLLLCSHHIKTCSSNGATLFLHYVGHILGGMYILHDLYVAEVNPDCRELLFAMWEKSCSAATLFHPPHVFAKDPAAYSKENSQCVRNPRRLEPSMHASSIRVSNTPGVGQTLCTKDLHWSCATCWHSDVLSDNAVLD